MKKEKFIYNPQTLRFEKVQVTLKNRLTKLVSLTSVLAISSLVLSLILHNYLPSPKEKLLMSELANIKEQYFSLSERLETFSKSIDNVQDRDRQIYKVLLGMEPIDESVWNGGVGGHNMYEEYKSFPNTGNLIVETKQRIDKLNRQLNMQIKSLDSMFTKASKNAERLACIPSIKPVREDKLKRNVSLLSGYGMRIHPIHKIKKMHEGIDFTAPKGTPIQATGNGKVITVERGGRGYGNHVVIDHGYGYQSLYGHMETVTVKEGQTLAKGQQIGTIGSTGTSTAPHCHYEVRYKGNPINPIDYVLDGLTPSEYMEMIRQSQIANQALDY